MIRSILCLLAVSLLLSLPAGAGEVTIFDDGPACSNGVCSIASPVYAEAVPVLVAPARAPRRVVIRQENHITVNAAPAGSAQCDAEAMASTGVMRHQGHNHGCREGVGYSTRSADDAIRRCCFYGRYRAREIGVARGPRGWFACVRYE